MPYRLSNYSFLHYHYSSRFSHKFTLPTMWYARITINPAYSPAAPALGCREKESKPVIVHNISPRFLNISCNKNMVQLLEKKIDFGGWFLFKKRKNLNLVTSSLLGGGKRVEVRKGRPCNRHHLSCCIQFHRTRSQGNHAVAQGEILWLKPMNVPK